MVAVRRAGRPRLVGECGAARPARFSLLAYRPGRPPPLSSAQVSSISPQRPVIAQAARPESPRCGPCTFHAISDRHVARHLASPAAAAAADRRRRRGRHPSR